MPTFGTKLVDGLSAESALRRFLSATVIEETATALYATSTPQQPLAERSPLVPLLSPTLFTLLQADPPSTYAEMGLILQRIQSDCQALYAAFATQGKVPADKLPSLGAVFGIQQAHQVAKSFDALVPHLGRGAKKMALPLLEERQRKIVTSIGYYEATKSKHDRQVFAALGGAVIALRVIPAKLTPVIRSITNSIKVSSFSLLFRPSPH